MIDLTTKYKEHLEVLNYSPGTIKNHVFYLKRFKAYLKDQGIEDVTAVAKETIRDYQIEVYQEINQWGRPNGASHQNNVLKVVKAFFRYLREHDYMVGDPAKDIPYAKEPKTLPRSILTKTEIKKLLKVPDKKTTIGYRDKTILELLYSTGIRKQEVNNLLVQDVDYNDGFLRVNGGKGRKDRVTPIGKVASRYLENYIKGVRPDLIKDPYNQHLFLSLRGKGLSKNMVWEMVKKYTKRTKIKKNVSPHTFRHTCATLMLKNKANIRHIQELLGHASLNSTQTYAHVSITELKEVHKRCHPREKEKE